MKENIKRMACNACNKMLLELDEETYHKIDVCNPVRVLRALEIVYKCIPRNSA